MRLLKITFSLTFCAVLGACNVPGDFLAGKYAIGQNNSNSSNQTSRPTSNDSSQLNSTPKDSRYETNNELQHSNKPQRSLTVSFKVANGQYVCVEGGGDGQVIANRDEIGAWETFQIVDCGIGKVAIHASNGKFLCAEGGGGGQVIANRDEIGPWETFEVIDCGGGKIAFRTNNGQYLCAEGGGGRQIVANREKIGPWETFQISK